MSDFTVHLLDVGAFNYGDSILCRFGGTTVLIDGGTPRSGTASQSVVLGEDVQHSPIQDQARKILGQTGSTLKVDLLVVTHCHSDHMGCLPDLVQAGKLSCDWALVADPQLGYGITSDSDEPPVPEQMSGRDKLWLALREEPLFDASDEQIAMFIADSAEEYGKYVAFVNHLNGALGDRCVVYRGPAETDSPGLAALLAQFSDTGLHIYGPSFDLLAGCAERLVGRSEDVMPDEVGDSTGELVEAYRTAVQAFRNQDAEDGEDGAAVNCQSLVMRVGPAGQQVLLTGDMQFASPAVGSVATPLVKTLLTTVNADAPFAAVKLSHHGASNGQNKTILTKWGAPLLAISTGSKSTKHPTEPVLVALEQIESSGVTWGRVDMNGRCTFTSTQSTMALSVERGSVNDKTRPSARSGDAVVETGLPGPPEAPRFSVTQRETTDLVEVHVTVPHRKTKVTVTIQVEPDDAGPFGEAIAARRQRADAPQRRLGDGRQLPRLVFATDPDRLARLIGAAAVQQVSASLQGGPHVFVTGRGDELLARVRTAIKSDTAIKGVVLLGGYGVVPSQIISTLPAELADLRIPDRDRLQVWSDDGYGDRDGDGVPELPVSRVPDGRSAEFLLGALKAAPQRTAGERSGIRNIRRPFANGVYGLLPGRRPLFTSAPTPPDVPPFPLAGDVLYLMLHGMSSDTSVFTGEDDDGGYPVALSVDDVPTPCPPVVLTGCCYGALIVDTRARDAQPGSSVGDIPVRDSIALTCLQRGANAFIGCTGVHYSPTQGTLTYFGEPMHRRFVQHVLSGKTPSEALWSAKVDYAAGIPHRPGARPEEIAYEHKILRQFTCLGLGW
jgi:beta-lactamase superfamily II metal-dependent hydrolase